MRIVVDMQGAQAAGRRSAAGRYAAAFVRALVRGRGGHEIVLALNGGFADTIDPIVEAFDGLLPRERIRTWYAPGPVRAVAPGNAGRRGRAALIRDTFLASLGPDIVHLTSPFDGVADDAVTDRSPLRPDVPVSASFFGLPARTGAAASRMAEFGTFDLLLATSDASAAEARRVAGQRVRVADISLAADGAFVPRELDAAERAAIRRRLGVDRDFVAVAAGEHPGDGLDGFLRSWRALPARLRERHQVVVTGVGEEALRRRLATAADGDGLAAAAIVAHETLSDSDLAALYTLCQVMVVPADADAFGLTMLEAMSCGASVLAADTPVARGLVEDRDALFDGADAAAAARHLERALAEEAVRVRLKTLGLRRAMQSSWEKTAEAAFEALEGCVAAHRPAKARSAPARDRRLKLAFVSPLPPEQTGIAEYAIDLIPALSRHYDVVVVVDQKVVDGSGLEGVCEIRDAAWLMENAGTIDRVLYHIGNSPFHDYMFGILDWVPGVVVLHDFFLSSYLHYKEITAPGHEWSRALCESHGYAAVRERFKDDVDRVRHVFPANADAIRKALGVLFHSRHARALAEAFYPAERLPPTGVVPMPRHTGGAPAADRAAAKNTLDVCAFGFVQATKYSLEVVRAFARSEIHRDANARLIFVGQNPGGDYGRLIEAEIARSKLTDKVTVTGWVDREAFQNHLRTADIAIQLRNSSRGETSAAVLDCMKAGVATIVNAHGSFAELPEDAVVMLPDVFTEDELVAALDLLGRDPARRKQLGARARGFVCERHSSEVSAALCAEAIERFYAAAGVPRSALLGALLDVERRPLPDGDYRALAADIAATAPERKLHPRIFFDITQTIRTDLKTGIERVARALTLALLDRPPPGFLVEPVYLSHEHGRWLHRHARHFTLGLLDCPPAALADDIADMQAGDVLVSVDYSGQAFTGAERQGLFAGYRHRGVRVFTVVHDVLPVQAPEFFPPGADAIFGEWLAAAMRQDGVACVSRASADGVARLKAEEWGNPRLRIGWFHHGADLANSAPSAGLPPEAPALLARLRDVPTFLMVGTIEPRKGHLQTIAAFEQLWAGGEAVNLVIVGREGWAQLPAPQRRTIPETVSRLRNHPERDRHLFWIDHASDAYLEEIYAHAACLLAASDGEGFGLPVIEGARHRLPVLARDIPVFREVAGDHATYFTGRDPADLAASLRAWLAAYRTESHVRSDGMPWITWAESARQLMACVLPR